MTGNSFHQLFLLGANQLAASIPEGYGPTQVEAGFTEEEWNLLQSPTMWSKAEQMKVASVIQNACSICCRVAGLPAIPLPGAFVAATICKLIPAHNRILAAVNAPENFDVRSAAGLDSAAVQELTPTWQMIALVTYFSSAEFGALESFALDAASQALVDAQNELGAE